MNGSAAVCDILIGMDGIRSIVRKGFLQGQGFLKSPSIEPIWTGTVAYRGLFPKETLESVYPNHRAATGPVLVS
jgi:salicylate hydroxylase